MPSIDIRDLSADQIDSIVFADDGGYLIENNLDCISISDGTDCVFITSTEHAHNLIKALSKAIEIGWLK